MFRTAAIFVALALTALPGHSRAQQAPDAAPAKSIRLLISSGPGAFYDIYGRLVAKHLGTFLPGKPTIIPENMVGADGLNAANYLYNNAPKDGSVIATFNSAIALYQALGQPGIRFQAEKFGWIGSLQQATSLVVVWHTAGIRSLDDAKRHDIIMGATGTSGTMAGFPSFLNKVLGTRFKIVTGYESAGAVDLAIERGEVQGRAMMTWPTLTVSKPSWIRDRTIIPILQIGARKDPNLPDVPLLADLAKTDDETRMFALASSTVSLGQPYATAPNVPVARLDALRKGFADMGNDADFIADERKIGGGGIPTDIIAGGETQHIVDQVIATPPDLIARVKSALRAQ